MSQKIRESNEIHAYEFVDTFQRRAHLCKYQCQCYTDKFALALRQSQFNGMILNSRVRGDFGVNIERTRTDNTRMQSWYLYHSSLIIIDRDFRVGVVDPIMFGDASVRSLSSWYDRIKEPEISLEVSFY